MSQKQNFIYHLDFAEPDHRHWHRPPYFFISLPINLFIEVKVYRETTLSTVGTVFQEYIFLKIRSLNYEENQQDKNDFILIPFNKNTHTRLTSWIYLHMYMYNVINKIIVSCKIYLECIETIFIYTLEIIFDLLWKLKE